MEHNSIKIANNFSEFVTDIGEYLYENIDLLVYLHHHHCITLHYRANKLPIFKYPYISEIKLNSMNDNLKSQTN